MPKSQSPWYLAELVSVYQLQKIVRNVFNEMYFAQLFRLYDVSELKRLKKGRFGQVNVISCNFSFWIGTIVSRKPVGRNQANNLRKVRV